MAIRQQQVRATIAFMNAAVLLMLPVGGCTRKASNEKSVATKVRPVEIRALSFTAEAGYVGSGACTGCHSTIADSYHRTHSMASSMSLAGKESVVEDYQDASFATRNGRMYQVHRTPEQILHTERLIDAQGDDVAEQTEKIAYVLGSGRRGRAYVVDRGGQLFQSPISWYAQQSRWDLSPGYPPDGHMRFDRKVQTGCVFCHAGLSRVANYGNDSFLQPAFAEFAIGCERCHGPGKSHIEKQTRQSASGPDSSIVNPVRLPAHERDSVCFQCHMRSEFFFARSGRRFEDFRPGQAFEDVFLAFYDKHDADPVSMPLVQQFRSSRCYVESSGELGCITCHEPHSRPSPEQRAEFYRERCSRCHDQRSCKLDIEAQNQPPASGSCVHCHMPPLPAKGIPHTALTDHRIRRRPADRQGSPGRPGRAFDVLRDDSRPLPAAEMDRAWGAVFASMAARNSDRELALQALSFFTRSEQASSQEPEGLQDILTLERSGMAHIIAGHHEAAIAAWESASRREPANEAVLHAIVLHAFTTSQFTRAIENADRLIAANPHVAEYYMIRSRSYEKAGNAAAAIRDAERALELDPTALAIRQWLVDQYQGADRSADAKKQQEIVRRLGR